VSAQLELIDVSRRFGERLVLDRVDLTLERGEVMAVLGPSGVGKTTLLRIVSGFDAPDAGRVLVAGREVSRAGEVVVPPERRGVTIVPQEGALFPHLDVAGNVAFGLSRRRSSESRRRVAEVLALVGLDGAERLRPEQLSGGMQQRVALARALAPNPDLVLLDEPFAALDLGLRAQVREATVAALRAAGATALWVTHDQEEALATADRVAVILDRHVEQVAAPVDLYRRPASRRVAEFVGDVVELRGRASGDRVSCALGDSLPLDEDVAAAEVVVVLRPEQLTILPTGGSRARVVGTKFFGHDGLVEVVLDDGERVDVRVQAAALPRVGEFVGVGVTGTVRVFPDAAQH